MNIPDWLNAYILVWSERLHLQHWTIRVQVALCVGSHPDTRALCEQYPDINTAHLTFRADIEDTPEWRRTVIHEMLHIAHARVDHYIERAALPRIPTAEAQALAADVYRQQVEAFIEAMAHTLYDASCAIDYPEEASE